MIKIGQEVYFYYSNELPCVRARLADKNQELYCVEWLGDNGKVYGESEVNKEKVFKTQGECIEYWYKIEYEKEKELTETLKTKKDVIEYMLYRLYDLDCDWETERKVLKKKIRELFDIDVDMEEIRDEKRG